MLMPVEEALERVLRAAEKTPVVNIPLADADDMALAKDLVAQRSQPPFAASAMDGYAVRHEDVVLAEELKVIGEAAAGHRFHGSVEKNEAVRIFTGAPMPTGADTVLIQEDAVREGALIRPTDMPDQNVFVRPAGFDFAKGDVLVKAGTKLDFKSLSLAAALNIPNVPVHRAPVVAIISSGDELVSPGEEPGPDQIIASNAFGVASLVRKAGGVPLDMGIVADSTTDIVTAFSDAKARGADIIVTLGGASVGDHDLIRQVLLDQGADLDFWKIAMRPGKPFMFGKLDKALVLGMPGNPVSSLVCSLLFLRPLLLTMQGLPSHYPIEKAKLSASIGKNGPRQGYLRAYAVRDDAVPHVSAFEQQDSSLLSVLNKANCLLIRPPFAKSEDKGAEVEIMWL